MEQWRIRRVRSGGGSGIRESVLRALQSVSLPDLAAIVRYFQVCRNHRPFALPILSQKLKFFAKTSNIEEI